LLEAIWLEQTIRIIGSGSDRVETNCGSPRRVDDSDFADSRRPSTWGARGPRFVLACARDTSKLSRSTKAKAPFCQFLKIY